MTYCINPSCPRRENSDRQKVCAACGTLLLIRERYRLIRPIQELSHSKHFEVFEAEDFLSGNKILKILKTDCEVLINIFRREAQVLSWLDHPGIPAVEPEGYFPFPSEDNPILHCLAMERVEGQNLEMWRQKYQLISSTSVLKWLQELIQILDLLHKKNLFHGDIKPSNIIRKLNGQLVLIDFGAVRQSIQIIDGLENLTILTPGYAPPEQFNRQAVPQSDFYALGRTFVHLLTGQHPLDLEKEGQLIWRQYLPPQFPALLADFIDDLMAPEISDRPSNTDEALQRIDQIFHILLASPISESPELSIIPETNPKQTKNKLKSSWKNHKGVIFIIALLPAVLWAIFLTQSQFKNYSKRKLPIKFDEVNLLPDEVVLENQQKLQAVEGGRIVAIASFHSKTDTFIVDDTAKDSRRAYVEYRIPDTGQRGICEDADGASSPLQSCKLNFKKNLYIYWRVCVRDADGPKPTVCAEIRKDKT
jgi:serine/threonine protein kinase